MRFIKKLTVQPFYPNNFNQWEKLANLMHLYYVHDGTWNFGYKCPSCNQNDFDIINNPQNASTRCRKCGESLVSFFSLERTKNYFSRDKCYGMTVHKNKELIGWIIGFEENLQQYNKGFSNRIVFNLSYICIVEEYRKHKYIMEKLKRMINNHDILSKFFTPILGEPIVFKLYREFETYIKNLGYTAITTKLSTEKPYLWKLCYPFGFREIGPWIKDPDKKIWIKNIGEKHE